MARPARKSHNKEPREINFIWDNEEFLEAKSDCQNKIHGVGLNVRRQERELTIWKLKVRRTKQAGKKNSGEAENG